MSKLKETFKDREFWVSAMFIMQFIALVFLGLNYINILAACQ